MVGNRNKVASRHCLYGRWLTSHSVIPGTAFPSPAKAEAREYVLLSLFPGNRSRSRPTAIRSRTVVENDI